jgi:hypothetical protein
MSDERSEGPLRSRLLWPVVAMVIGGMILLFLEYRTNLFTRPTESPETAMPLALLTVQSTLNTFSAKEPLVVNGISYPVPMDSTQRCIGEQNRQTGIGVSRTYELVVPAGWVIVWDSDKAYWTPGDGKYESDGLLAIYGYWKGTVQIISGEYCAAPIEWAEFAVSDRRSAVIRSNRIECFIGSGISNPGCR